MIGTARRAVPVAIAACALSVAACGVNRPVATPSDLAITTATLTQCTASVQASPVTCEVAAVIANAGHAATTLDYSRLLLRDAQGGSYPPVAPTGAATLAAGGSFPVTLSFVIFQDRTPTQLELAGAGGTGGSVTAALAAAPAPSPTPSPAGTTSPPSPSPSKPRVAPTSHVAPATSAAPAYVPPPVYYAPPPVYYAPPPNPVSGGFGNG